MAHPHDDFYSIIMVTVFLHLNIGWIRYKDKLALFSLKNVQIRHQIDFFSDVFVKKKLTKVSITLMVWITKNQFVVTL